MKNLKLVKFIQTKYIGQTNFKGSRCKAFDAAGNSVTIHWNNELGVDDNHYSVAQALLDKLNDKNRYGRHVIKAYGGLKDGYCYVAEYKDK